MALLARENRSDLSAAFDGIHPSDPALADLWGGGTNSKSGQNVNSDSAMRTSAVYACVTIHAQTMAMLPKCVLEIQPEGGKKRLLDHRYSKLIGDRPNRWQSDFEFYEYMAGCRWLRGNAYAYQNFNPGRQENEWVPMDPARVWPFIKTPSGVIYYLYDNSPPPPVGSQLFYQYFPLNAESVILRADEVLHIRGFSRNGIIGMDPITRAAREAIGLSMATEEHGAKFFNHGAQISKVFTHPGKLGDIAYNRLKEDFNSKYRQGGQDAGGTIILEEGMNIANLSMTMEAAQYLETRKFSVEEIARFYNMPLVLIGHGDKAPTYSSVEQFFLSFKVHTVHPEVNRWRSAMQRQLLYPSEVGKIEFNFDMDELIRGDAVSRANYLQKRFLTSSITPDEIKVYEGENPSGTEGGKKLYIQSNMVPLDQAGQITKPQPSQGATE